MKENNYSLILRTIHHYGTIERVKLVELTALSPSTVTRCVNELINENYVVEIGTLKQGKEKKVGRRAISLKINPKSFRVLLVDVGAYVTNYAFGYADGTIEKLESSATPDDFYEIIAEAESLIHSYKGTKDVEVVAFSIPGMVDVENDTILFVPTHGWKNIKIEITGKVVYADNEANLAMIAEAFKREEVRKSKCSVFVTVREGFGTGLWINGEIFRGPSFTAGEFGHTTIDLEGAEHCKCGKDGCIDPYISVSKNFGEYSRNLQKFFTSEDWKNSPKVLKYIDLLSKALANVVNSLNPEYLIVGGELAGLSQEFYKFLEDKVKSYSLEHASKILKILPPTFSKDTYLYGALYAAIEDYYIPKVISKIK
ncbi:ROK family transcriptional regulator [Fervidobacterium islandicum]|uniref:ROK family transcriptional regulator n=1 Tax=Fervidobacterium islandicum TaxID=2423 RepID=A0AAI8CMU3_FERIS|nr:ROK family transcriptional regulator [Fervidobacterium islandicum]AMW33502.1 ROK family transcriptional regulator [Fervidobacterium islandicum]